MWNFVHGMFFFRTSFTNLPLAMAKQTYLHSQICLPKTFERSKLFIVSMYGLKHLVLGIPLEINSVLDWIVSYFQKEEVVNPLNKSVDCEIHMGSLHFQRCSKNDLSFFH